MSDTAGNYQVFARFDALKMEVAGLTGDGGPDPCGVFGLYEGDSCRLDGLFGLVVDVSADGACLGLSQSGEGKASQDKGSQ